MKNLLSLKPMLLLCAFFLFMSQASYAQKTWDGGGDGTNWNSGDNWNPNGVPTSSDAVTIASNGTVTVNTTSAVCASLQLGGTSGNTRATLTFASSGSPKLTVTNDVTVGGEGSTNSNRGGTITFVSGSTLQAGSIILTKSTSGDDAPGIITMVANSRLLTGSFAIGQGSSRTWTPSTGTVVLTANNTLPSSTFTTFGNLKDSIGTTTLSTNITVNESLSVSKGATLALSTFTLGSPTSLNLECGAVTGSSITGSGILTLAGNINVTYATTGTDGADMTCPVALGADRTITVADDGTSATDLTMTGIISGSFGITKNGAGELHVSGANTYTGTTTVGVGRLKLGASSSVNNAGPLGTTGAGTSVTSGAVLDLNGFSLTSAATEALTLNGTGISSGGALTNSSGTASNYIGLITIASAASIITNAGDINLTNSGAFTSDSYVLTLGGTGNGNISGGFTTNSQGITKTGTGTWKLSGTNLYQGNTLISQGTLQLGSTTALGSTNGSVTVSSGGALDLNGITLTVAKSTTINGTGITSLGAITNSSASTATYSGTITLGSNSSIVGETGSVAISNTGQITGTGFTLTLGGATGGSFSGALNTGSGGLTKTGTGTWTINTQNYYTGNTSINAGTLKLGIGVLSNVTDRGPLGTTASGTTVADGAVLDLNGYSIETNEALTLNGSGLTSSPVGALTNTSTAASFAGNITLGAASTIIATASGTLACSGTVVGAFGLTLGGAGTGTMSGIISTPTSLTKNGAGTWTLSGTNTYTGTTTVSAGTLVLNNTSALGANTNSFVISTGAKADIITNETVGSMTLGGMGTANGTWGFTGSSATYIDATFFTNSTTGRITVGNDSRTTPTVTPTVATYTYNGSAQGPNTATNTGTGTSYTFSYAGTGGTTYGPSSTRPTNAGTYTVTVTVAANANYTAASSSATAFTIANAPLTITANNQTKCFGTTFTFAGTEFTTSGLVGGNTVTSATLSSTGSASSATAGNYPIVITNAAGTGLSNYTISYVNGTLTVNASPDISNFSIGGVTNPAPGGTSTVTINSTSIANGTYTVTYNLTGDNTATGSTASVAIAAGTGTFATSALATAGYTTITITAIKTAGNCSSTISSGNSATILILAEESETITNTATTTWTAPLGVTSVKVEVWGGGGRGGSTSNNSTETGGGGGGAYALDSSIAVTAGTTYNLNVADGSTSTSAGEDSWFNTTGTVLAKGGNSGATNSSTGATGGSSTNSIGDVKWAGGNGANGSDGNNGGGGGSSAGTSTFGASATNSAGATAPSGGGNGGGGRTGSSGNGTAGSAPGGGGGGVRSSSGDNRTGGAGARGQVKITYKKLTYKSQIISASLGSTNWCAGETRDVTVTIKNIGTATWTDGTGGTPTINIGIKWNTNTTNWADYYVRTSANNLAPGETGTYTFTITASNNTGSGYTSGLAAGNNNLIFDVVYEGISWFADNGGGVGPGNTKFTSPVQTINAVPSAPTGTSAARCGTGTVSLSASGTGTIKWYDASTGGTLLSSGNSYTTPSISSTTIYYAKDSIVASGCVSATRTAVTATVNAVPSAPTGTSAARCGTGTVSLSASGTGTIKWYNASTGGTLLGSGSSYTTPSISSTTIYYAMDSIVATGCISATRTAVTATVNAVPSAPTGTSAARCGTGTVSLSASGTGTIKWYNASTAGTLLSSGNSYTTPSISSTTIYYAMDSIVATGCTSTRTAVTATVNAVPSAPTGTDAARCGTGTVSLSASGTGTIKWYDASTAGTLLSSGNSYTTPSISSTTIYYAMDSIVATGCISASRTAVTATVNAVPSAPTGTSAARCGTGTVNLSATGTGTIKWYDASTGGTLLSSGNSYTTPSISSTTIYYAMDSIVATGCISATRTAVTATVNAVPSAPTGTDAARCGTGTVGLSASGTGTIKWYSASTGGTLLSSGSSYTTPSISSTTIYYATDSIVATGCTSTRTAVTATINTVPSAPTGTDAARCGTGTVSLSATGTGTIKWYNASTGGTLLTSGNSYTTPSISSTTIYYAMDSIVATGCISATRTAVTATVNSVPSAPTGTSAARCGTGTVGLSASGTGTIKWYNASTGGTLLGSGSSFTTPSISSTTIYYAMDSIVASGCVSATRTAVTATINTVPSAPTGTSASRCGTGTVSLSASGTGTTKWYNASTGGTLLTSGNSYTTPSISSTTIYYVLDSIVATGCTSTRTAVTATINTVPLAPTGTSAARCGTGTVGLSASGTGTIKWYDVSTGGTLLSSGSSFTTPSISSTTIYYAMDSIAASGCISATRTAVTATVNAVPSVPTGTDGVRCGTGTVSLSASGTGTIKWYNASTGGTLLGSGSSFTTPSISSTTIYYTMDSIVATGCVSATRDAVTATVNAVPSAPTGTSASRCGTGTVSLSASGTGTIKWYNASTGGTLLSSGNSYTTPSISSTTIYYALDSINATGCTSTRTAVTATVNTNVGISSATAASSSICSSATTTLTANGVVGTNAVVTWWTAAGGTGTNLGTGTTLTNRAPGTYFARVTGDCGTAVEASVTVSSKVNVGITSATAATSAICPSSTTTLTANGVTGTNAVVTWWSGTGGTGTNYGTGTTISVGPGTYYARVTGDCGSAVQASVTVSSLVNAGITSATSGASSVCSDATTTLTANGAVGTNAVVTWWTATGGTGTNLGTGTTITRGPGTYYARVTADCGSAVEASVTVGTLASPSVVLGSPTNSSICSGLSQVLSASATISSSTLTTIGSDNFTTPVFSTEGTNSGGGTIFSNRTSPYQAGDFTRVTNNLDNSKFMIATADSYGSATTNSRLISPTYNTIGYQTLNVTFYHSYNQVSGSAKVEVSADGGTNWTTLKTYTSDQGGTSNFVKDSVDLISYINQTNLKIRFNASISVFFNTAWWAIDNVELKGLKTNMPLFSWSANTAAGVNGLTANAQTYLEANSTTTVTPTSTTLYTLTAKDPTTHCTSSASSIMVNVLSNPSAPTGTDAARCGAGTVSLSASGTGTIKWYDASTGGILLSSGNSYTTPSISTTTIYYAMDSIVATGCVSSTRTAVTATVNAVPSAPTGTSAARCGTGTVNLSASGTGTIKWYDASTGGTLLTSGNSYTTPSISSTTIYYAMDSIVATGCTSTRTAVTATVNTVPSAPTGTSAVRCGTGTVGLSASGTGTIKWYNASTGGTLLSSGNSYTTPSISSTTIYYAMDSIVATGCTSATKTAVTATVNAVPSAPTGTSAVRCGTGTVSLSASGTGTIKWYNASTGGTLLSSGNSYTTPSISTTTIYYAMDSIVATGCISATRTAVTATVNAVPSAPTGTSAARCGTGTVGLSATGTGTIKWYNASTGGTLLSSGNSYTTPSISTTTIYYVLDSINATGCKSDTRTAVTATVNAIPSAPTGTSASRCGAGTVELSATATGTIKWYNASTGGTLLSSGNSYTTPSISSTIIYYALDSIETTGCKSSTRTAVTATINAVPSAPTGTSAARCGTGTVGLSATGTGTIKWYTASTAGTLLSSGNSYTTPSISSTTIYYALDSINATGCTSATRTAVTATINAVPSAPTGTSAARCGTGTVGLSATGTGTIKWYNASTGGTLLSSGNSYTTPSISTTTIYYVLDSINATGCKSDTRTAVTATVNAIPSAPTGTSASRCGAGTVELSATGTGTIKWYNASTGGTLLSSGNSYTTPSISSTTIYYALDSIETTGCKSSTRTAVVATINNLTTSNDDITNCTSYFWNGITYTTSGNYSYSTTNAAGCDSTATLNLTITLPSESDTSITNCDSYVWNGTTYSNSGTYTFTTTNSVGCDSVATLNLTINRSTSNTDNVTICDTYTWNGTTYSNSGTYSFSTTNDVGCDSTATLNLTINRSSTSLISITVCDEFTWNGDTYTTSGMYTYSTTNSVGCDSVASLNLTVKQSTTSTTTIEACDAYRWNNATYSASGIFTYTTNNAVGCDSVASLNLTINYSSLSETNISNCDNYLWNGVTYSVSGTYSITTTNAVGCDSVATLNLTILESSTSATNESACEQYTWNGVTYSNSGTYTYLSTNASGCSSTDTLHLTIKRGTTSTTNATNCETYAWNGSVYSNTGTFTYNTTNSVGCDSIALLNLTILNGTNETIYAESCVNYFINDSLYTESGTYTQRLINSVGCDSILTIILTITQGTFTSNTVSNCDSYMWNNILYTRSGQFIVYYNNASGCLSADTLYLTIRNSSRSTTSISACNSYSWNGEEYTASGVYTYITTNSANCDSTATLNLTIETAPNLNPISGLTDVCMYTTTTYSSNVLGGKWSSDETTKLRIDSITGVATSIASGVANITYLITTSLGCTNSVSLEVTVLEAALITISGLDNVCNGSTITLSSNEDDGIWSVDNSTVASIDSSSGIVQGVTAGNALITYTYIEESSGCVSIDTFTVTVNPLPAAPDSIVGLQELCQYVNTSDTIEYSVPLVSGITTYNWIMPIGAIIVSGQNTSTIRVLFTNDLLRAGAKIYVNSVSDAGCISGTTFLRIYKTIPYLFTLTGPNNACPLVGLDTVVNYTTNISSTASYYDWVVPTGATIVSGQGTYQIGVTYDTSFRSGYIRVRGLSNCGVMSGTGKYLAIIRSLPSAPGFINGPANVCAYYNNGTEVVYSITDVAFATSYVWTLPNNVTLVSGQGTNTIVVRFESGFVNSTLKVRALSNCSSTLDRGINLTANPYTVPDYVSGPTNACMYVNTGNMATYVCAKSTGAPSYIWNVPAGVTIIERPGDMPENDTIIRVLFDENFVTATNIQVQTTGCNTSVARVLTINKTVPSTPGSITGTTNVCNYIGSSTSVRYSTRRVLNATQYMWTVPNDAQIQSYDGDTAINVTFNSGYATGMIEARSSNACSTSSARVLSVSRALPATPTAISGPASSCAYYNNGTTATFSIPAVLGATGYTWTLPSYMTLVSGQNTTSISVRFDSGFVTSNLKVRSLNACATSIDKTLSITATPYATPGIITGPTNSCIYINDGIATYTIRKVANATGYLWTVPTGATIIDHPAGAGALDTIIKVTYTPDFVFGMSIKVQSMGCGLSNAKTLTITGAVSSQPGTITGTSNVCEFVVSSSNPNGIIATYRIGKISSANAYAWTAPANATIVGHPAGLGINDTIVQVKFSSEFLGGAIKVRSSNSCGSSSERSFTVSRTQPSTPGVISTTNLSACPNRMYRYSISSMPTNATSVVWTVPTEASIVSRTALSITVSYLSAAITGTVKAQSFNNCSSSDFRSISVRYTACPNSIIGTTPVVTGRVEEAKVEFAKPLSLGVSVYPNPTTSAFKVKVKAVSAEKLHIKLMDMAGRYLKVYQIMPGEDLNFGNELKAGVYMIEVTQGNLKSVERLMKF